VVAPTIKNLRVNSVTTFMLSVAFIAIQGVHLHVLLIPISFAFALYEYQGEIASQIKWFLYGLFYLTLMYIYSLHLGNLRAIYSYSLHVRFLMEILVIILIYKKSAIQAFPQISIWMTIWTVFYMVRAILFPIGLDTAGKEITTVDSSYMVSSMMLSLRLWTHFGGNLYKRLSIVNSACLAFAVFFGYTDSRGAILSLVVFLFLEFPWSLVFAPLILLIDYEERFKRMIEMATLFSGGTGGGTIDARTTLWNQIIEANFDNPLGLGFNGYANLAAWQTGKIQNVESLFFEILSTGGWLYVGIVGILFGKIIWSILKSKSGGLNFIIATLPSAFSNPYGLSHIFILLVMIEYVYSKGLRTGLGSKR
jgi:hypothetical protein